MDRRPELREFEREYECNRQADEAARRSNSLLDDALIVELEFGPAMRLDKGWRLEKRQPQASSAAREAALEAARGVKYLAYELTDEAWPFDRDAEPTEVDRVAAAALETISSRYPDLHRESLRLAVSHANYSHAK